MFVSRRPLKLTAQHSNSAADYWESHSDAGESASLHHHRNTKSQQQKPKHSQQMQLEQQI